jgi:hypothetical protein
MMVERLFSSMALFKTLALFFRPCGKRRAAAIGERRPAPGFLQGFYISVRKCRLTMASQCSPSRALAMPETGIPPSWIGRPPSW